MGADGDELLAEDVEGVARETGRLDVAFVHGAGNGGAGDQVGPVLGKQNPLADGVDRVAGPADALHAAGDRRRRFDLDDEIDGSHVDAEFQGRGGAEGFDLAGLELLFDDRTLGSGEGTVVSAGDGFACQIVERAGEPLGDLAAVHEEDCGIRYPESTREVEGEWRSRWKRGGASATLARWATPPWY